MLVAWRDAAGGCMHCAVSAFRGGWDLQAWLGLRFVRFERTLSLIMAHSVRTSRCKHACALRAAANACCTRRFVCVVGAMHWFLTFTLAAAAGLLLQMQQVRQAGAGCLLAHCLPGSCHAPSTAGRGVGSGRHRVLGQCTFVAASGCSTTSFSRLRMRADESSWLLSFDSIFAAAANGSCGAYTHS